MLYQKLLNKIFENHNDIIKWVIKMKLGYFISRKIDKLTKKGNGFLENGEYEKAIEEYKKIIEALPEPKDEWDAYE